MVEELFDVGPGFRGVLIFGDGREWLGSSCFECIAPIYVPCPGTHFVEELYVLKFE